MKFGFGTNNGGRKLRVLFCGTGQFQSGYEYTKQCLLRLGYDLDIFQTQNDALLENIENVDVLVPFMAKISPDIIRKSTKLKLIMQFGVGLEGVDIPAATKKKIWVSRLPSDECGNASSCAEHAIYLSLSLLRNQFEMNKSIATRRLGVPTGRTLLGSTALIYGYGNIATHLSKRLLSFDTKINIITSKSNVELPSYINKIGNKDLFHDLAQESDIVYMCCTQNADTYGIVNSQFLNSMKKDSILINIARGGLLNYTDVLHALESGHLGGLGIDVFHTEPFPPSDPLLQHPRVIATPHVAGVTEISYRNMSELVARNIRHIIEGETPEWVVNDINFMNPTYAILKVKPYLKSGHVATYIIILGKFWEPKMIGYFTIHRLTVIFSNLSSLDLLLYITGWWKATRGYRDIMVWS
eukprot:gene2992-5865_t